MTIDNIIYIIVSVSIIGINILISLINIIKGKGSYKDIENIKSNVEDLRKVVATDTLIKDEQLLDKFEVRSKFESILSKIIEDKIELTDIDDFLKYVNDIKEYYGYDKSNSST